MLAVLLVTLLFIAVSIYFYFRAETLQRDILILKRESSDTKKENIALSKSMALQASNHEEFVKTRLNILITKTEQTSEKNDVNLLKPLINNYSLIFHECLTGKGKMQAIIKKCFNNHDPDMFKEFMDKIIKTDSKLKRLWGSNNLAGFISLVEALLVKYTDK
jgi:hypothetical protein